MAIVIGTIQVLALAQAILGNSPEANDKFWTGVTNLQNSWDIVGGAICGMFLVVGVLSVLLYKPWKRWADRQFIRRGQLMARSQSATADFSEIEVIAPGPEAVLDVEMVPLEPERGRLSAGKGDVTHDVDEITPVQS